MLKKLHLPKPHKPSLSNPFKKTPRRQDDNEEITPINQRGLQAPPNSPRDKGPDKLLFGTQASKIRDTRLHRLRDPSSSDNLSEESTQSGHFFDELVVSIDERTIEPILEKPSKHPKRNSEDLRQSLRDIQHKKSPSSEKRDRRQTDTTVPLELEIPTHPPTPQGLELKRAAAVLDSQHPLDLVPVFNAWLATKTKPTGLPLRLKTPAEGEPFMSRSLYSAQVSWKEHDAGKELPEQVAAYTLLDDLSKVHSDDRAVSDALAKLRTYLTKLELGTAHTVAGSHTYRRVLDTPELRQLLLKLEWAAAPKTLHTHTLPCHTEDSQNIPLSEDDRTSSGASLEQSI